MTSNVKKQIIGKYKYTEEQIYYFCHSPKAYTEYSINKKNGEKRKIMIPRKSLKEIQQRVLKELDYYNITNKYLSHQYAYLKKKNNIEFAKVHLNRKYIFKYDLKDYFNQITYPRVVGTLKKNGFSKEDADFISQLSCYREMGIYVSIAQGAPLSPFLSNIVSTPVDSFFMNYAKKYNDVKYSRYADDICLSTNDVMTFKNIKNDYLYIYKKLRNRGFILNDKKYRIYKKGRKIIGGIKINSKLNLKREYIDRLKLNLHYAKINYLRTVQDYCTINNNKVRTEDLSTFYEQSIRGKILYLSKVRGRNDNLVLNLKKEYNSVPEFIHKFDERQLYEKSIYKLEFSINKSESEEYDSWGTIFRVESGLITCYHNLFDFMHPEYYYHDFKIKVRNLEDQLVTYVLNINTSDIVKCVEKYKANQEIDRDKKRNEIAEYEMKYKVVINEDYDFVFLSNSFLSKHLNGYSEFDKFSKKLDIEDDESVYDDKKTLITKCYGYSRLRETDPRLNIKEIKAVLDKTSYRFNLDDYLGKGASGGPILCNDKVIAVYNKGINYEDVAQGISLNRFLGDIVK